MTFNGAALTQGPVATSGNGRSGIWYLPLGSSGAATTANVVVTYSQAYIFDVTAVTLQNVDQTTPISGATFGSTASLNVTSAAGDLVIDAISGFGSSVAIGAGQTLLANNNNILLGSDPDTGTSTNAGAASVTMAWTGYTPSTISHVGLNFRQASGTPVAITTASLPNAVVNVAGYNQTVTATGGTGAKTFAVLSGSLPTGLTINLAGTISGTPTAVGTFNFTISAVDTLGVIGSQAFTITISAAVTPVVVTPTTLPNAVQNVAGYNQTIAATGGTGAKTFAVTSGALPTGLTLSTAGALTGTPTAVGTFNFTITATDTLSATGAQAFTIIITAPVVAVSITTTTLPNAVQNVAGYNQTIAATGGTGAKTFAVTSGTLPTGLTLSAAGALSGTPTVAGTFNFTVTATDTVSATGAQAYTIIISAPATSLAITTTTLPNPVLNAAGYSQAITVTGGTGTTTFNIIGGALPPGLTITLAGTIIGTATTAGTFNFTIGAIDTAATVVSRAFTLVVNPVLTAQTITFSALGNKIVGDAPFALSATATSGLTVSFGVTGPATLTGTTLTLTGTPGVVTITASQIGNTSFAAAPAVVQSFTVAAPANPTRLINLSSRVRISPDPTRSLIAGFVIGGTQSKRVLLRAIGPTLTAFDVAGALVNPRLQLFDSTGAVVLENDDWSGADTAAAFTQVSAFPLTPGSKDAALVANLTPGNYTMQITAGTETGIALAEVYDASPNPGAETQRLVNISTRGMVEPGDGVLIGGFVIRGDTPKKVLIRGIGPRLVLFGVTGALADPRLTVFSGQTVIAQNDNWSVPTPVNATQTPATAAELTSVALSVGAFALGTGSLDAAVFVTLPPGSYTAQVAGAGTTTGVALVEIYEVP